MEAMKSMAQGQEFACPSYSLYQGVAETVETFPDQPAMHFYGHAISYRTFYAHVERLAAYLHDKGIGKGDRVGIMLPNCPQYVTAFYACMRLGAIVVQVNPLYTPHEVEYTLRDSGTKALVVLDRIYQAVGQHPLLGALQAVVVASLGPAPEEGFVGPGVAYQAALQHQLPSVPPAEIDAEHDVAVLQYTGGTTGRSKGAMLTHRNLVANVWQSIEMIGREQISEQDKILTAIPLFHVYGMTLAMNFALVVGASMVLLPRYETEEVLQTIQAYRPRFFPGVPTMYVAIVAHPDAEQYGVDCIEFCNSGSAPLPVEVMKRFEARTGARIMEGYGLSEAAPVTHGNPVVGERRAGSIGFVLPGTEAKVVDVATGLDVLEAGQTGELIVRGPQVMKGYWNLPEETAATLRDGWLYTGDIAKMDEDGYFYIVDRKKDMILASGYNVYPRDVEEVLYQHPAVLEAVVVGVPDEYRGETVKAVLVLKPDASFTSLEEELDAFCRERLAAFKVPRVYEVRTELPKTAVGKILRRKLREE